MLQSDEVDVASDDLILHKCSSTFVTEGCGLEGKQIEREWLIFFVVEVRASMLFIENRKRLYEMLK